MRKWLVFFVTLLCLPAMAGAQNLPKLGRDNPQTITVWTYYAGEQKRAFDLLVDEFNTTQGYDLGIVVQAEAKGSVSQLTEGLQAAVAHDPGAEDVPNLALLYADSAYPLAREGVLAPFGTYLSAEEMQGFVPSFLAEGDLLADGEYYLLPVAKATEVLVVNATWIEDFFETNPVYGWDDFATWEGIARMAAGYYEWTEAQSGAGRPLFGMDSAANFWVISYLQLGGELFSAERGQGKADLSNPAFAKAWEAYYRPMVAGHFAALGRFSSDDLKTGDILAFVGSISSTAYLPEEIVDAQGAAQQVSVRVLPLPVYQGGQPATVQQGASFALLADTAEKEYASAVFASWLTEPSRNIEFARQSGYLPVRSAALDQLAAELRSDIQLSPIEQAHREAAAFIQAGYRLYANPPFDSAYEARDAIGSLKDQARAAAEQGMNDRQAVDRLASEEAMRETIQRLSSKMQALGLLVE